MKTNNTLQQLLLPDAPTSLSSTSIPTAHTRIPDRDKTRKDRNLISNDPVYYKNRLVLWLRKLMVTDKIMICYRTWKRIRFNIYVWNVVDDIIK